MADAARAVTPDSGTQADVGRASRGLHHAWVRSRWFAPAAVVIVLLRVRWLFGTIGTDEGGQLAVAQAWDHGYRLYRDIWLDRPQGLLLIFRALVWIGLDNRVGTRLTATLLVLAGSAACGRIAARLGRPGAAWIAALVTGVLLSVPRMDGFSLNGENASAPIGALALACLLRAVWQRAEPSYRWLLLGGALGGAAFAVKQSAFDGFAVGALVVLALVVRRGWSARHRLLAIPTVVGGFLLVYGLALLHGALTGWDRWYDGNFGYRSTKLGLFAGAEWRRLGGTAKRVLPVVVVAVVLVMLLGVQMLRRRRIAPVMVLLGWSLFAAVGFFIGGRFFTHYWLVLIFPLGTAVGVGLADMKRSGLRSTALGTTLLIPLALSVYGLVDRVHETENTRAQEQTERVARWVNANTEPGASVYGQCMRPSLYAQIHSYPPFPYLWTKHIELIPERRAALAALFRGPQAPEYIAVFEEPAECDPSGVLAEVLMSRYRQVADVAGTAIYQRID